MSEVLDSSDSNGISIRWFSMLFCTLNYCFWMYWGSEVKVAVNVIALERCHPPITSQIHKWLSKMKYNKKLSKGRDAVTTAAKLFFCHVLRLTVTATRSNVLFSPAEHQDLCKKVEFDPLNLFLKLVLLTKYSTDVATHIPPPLPSAGSEAVSFLQVSLFGEGYNIHLITLQLRKP